MGLEQSGRHHHLIEMQLVLTMIWLETLLLDVKQQPLTRSLLKSKIGLLFKTYIII
jgi:Zn-dependent M16 (insulinase) family peptidase